MIVWTTFLRTFCKFVSSIRKSKRSSQCVNSCFLACNVLCMSFKLAKIDNVGRKLMVCTIYLQCMCSTPSIHNGHSTACSSPRSSSSSSIFSSHANGNFNLVIRYPLRPHRQLMVSLWLKLSSTTAPNGNWTLEVRGAKEYARFSQNAEITNLKPDSLTETPHHPLDDP